MADHTDEVVKRRRSYEVWLHSYPGQPVDTVDLAEIEAEEFEVDATGTAKFYDVRVLGFPRLIAAYAQGYWSQVRTLDP